MNPQFKTVALVGKYIDRPSGKQFEAGVDKTLAEIVAMVQHTGARVLLESATAAALRADAQAAGNLKNLEVATVADIGRRADVAIVVGGDGTMLGIARQLAEFDVPLIGINHGRVGFITDIALHEMARVLPTMLAGEFETEHRSLLQAHVERDVANVAQIIFQALALNDVVVSRGGISGMVELKVSVNGHFMYNQRADALIVATPTGSTAYALSAQGPILHPQLAGMVLVPVAPHVLSNRPIVLPEQCTIVIEIMGGKAVSANFDMQSLTELEYGDRVVIQPAPHRIRFLHPQGTSHFATLRNKLHWNELPRDAHL